MHKKSVVLFAFIGYPEVFDYLIHPITTSKAHAYNGGSAVALLWMDFLKVSKFQGNQCKLLRFFRYVLNARNELRFYIIGKYF